MSNWKKELKEKVKPSTDWSKYNITEIIEQSKKADASDEVIEALSKYSSIEEALESKRASYWCCWYATKVLKGRWIEAESIIIKDAYFAYWYTRDILKGRWIEAEPIIAKDKFWKNDYEKIFNCKI
jgi:hypothetical protein